MPLDAARVEAGVREAAEAVLGKTAYNTQKVRGWADEILRSSGQKLGELDAKGYKFILTCTLLESNGAGFYTGSAGYWEAETDGCATVQYQASANFQCIVSAYWVDSRVLGRPFDDAHEAFAKDEVKALAEKQIVQVLGEVEGYEHGQCAGHCDALTRGLLQSLVELGRPFKYVVSCTLLQRQPTAANDCPPYGTWVPSDEAGESGEGGEPVEEKVPVEKEVPSADKAVSKVTLKGTTISGDLEREIPEKQQEIEELERKSPSSQEELKKLKKLKEELQKLEDQLAKVVGLKGREVITSGKLSKLGVPFKTTGGAGGGFYTASSAMWDDQMDGSVTAVRDLPEAGKSLRCIVTVHAPYEGEYAALRPAAPPGEEPAA